MSKINSYNHYVKNEETVNVLTHGLGLILSMAGLLLLIIRALKIKDDWYLVGCIIFGISLLIMYASSTLYHLMRDEKMKQIFRKLDHSAIYLLIAGTYTPFLLTSLRGNTGWTMFVIIWVFAFVGITIKLATQIRSKWISAIIYLVMGWLAVFIAPEMIENLPTKSIVYLAAGGLFYTFGVVFYIWKSLPYHHPIWHLFVLGGSICHYFSIFYLV